MPIALDRKDSAILLELDRNSRQPNSTLAKKLKLSKDAVAYRIRRLEEVGVIGSYFTVIDSSKLGYSLYRVFINLIDIDSKTGQRLIDFLAQERNTWRISDMDGAWNFGFAIWVKSNQEFHDFYHGRLCAQFRGNIKDALICPVTRYQQWERSYLTGGAKNFPMEITGIPKKADFDELDKKILQAMASNAKAPLILLAQKLGVDSMTIHRRIKKLEREKVIQGYKAKINIGAIGRDSYSVKINLKNLDEIGEIRKHVKNLQETIAIIEAIGSFDLEFDLEVENSEKYYSIIREIKDKFPTIREIKYFRTIKDFKEIYLPKIG